MDKLTLIADEFWRRAAEIPFGNSDFQSAAFIEAAALTPERAYRAVLLQLNGTLEALQTAYYQLQREELEIERLQAQIKADETEMFTRRLAIIDCEEKLAQRSRTQKLWADALHQVEWFWERLQQYPEFTRMQFEMAEEAHFELKLQRQVDGITGAQEALFNKGIDSLALQARLTGLLNPDKGIKAELDGSS